MLVGVEHGLHGAQVGEGGVQRHVDVGHVGPGDQVRQLLHERDRLEVVVVHLPVAGDERASAVRAEGRSGQALGADRSASRPGRSPSSISSSDAPPPVEMWSISVGQPELRHRRGRVAPTDDREAPALGHRFGDGSGAGLEAGVFERPHGPVPQHGPGLVDDVAEGGGGAGTDVDPHPALRQRRARLHHLAARPGSNSLPPSPNAVMSSGRRMRSPALASSSRQVSTWSTSSSESPTLRPWARRNVKHMAPPMTSVSHTSSRALITPELVGHLRAAEDGHERPRRVVADAQQDLDLLGQQPAGGGGQRGRRADDGGVGPVRGAEGVVHVAVEAGGQTGHERRVVALFTGVEAQVLGQFHAGADLTQAAAHGVHGVAGIGLALRSAEVRAGHDRAAPCSFNQTSVGNAALMRRSSVISPPCMGTLKSTRTSTARPSTGGRSSRTGHRNGHVGVSPVTNRLPGVSPVTKWAMGRRERPRGRAGVRAVFSPGWRGRRSGRGRRGGSSSPTRCRTSRAPSRGCPWPS